MNIDIRRGIQNGAIMAVVFAAITPLNNLLRGEPISWDNIVVGSAAGFCLFGLVGMLTKNMGGEVGDA